MKGKILAPTFNDAKPISEWITKSIKLRENSTLKASRPPLVVAPRTHQLIVDSRSFRGC